MNLAWASATPFFLSHNGMLLIRNANQTSNRGLTGFLKSKIEKSKQTKNSKEPKLALCV